MPDVPIKPKLFRYKIDTKKSFQYELSSVELNQEHIINVDYNMSMPVDLIDRDVLLPFPKAFDPEEHHQLGSSKKEVDPA